jgi:hypothetical protein
MSSPVEIAAILEREASEAEQRFREARAMVDSLLQKPTGTLRSSDGIHCVYLAIKEETKARELLKRAALRRLEFRVNGAIPEDLETAWGCASLV